jgi:RNA polymerase sigma-70 factor (ECF subfamily)
MERWASGRLPRRARCLLETGDLVQATLLKTTRRLARFEPRHAGSFPAYLRKSLLNLIRDESRKLERRPDLVPLDGTEIDPTASPLDHAVGRDLTDRYEAAFGRLSDQEQATLFLKIEMDLSFDDIAVALDKPSADAARMAARRALIHLAREMDHAGQAERR